MRRPTLVRRRSILRLEQLERRDAPATLVSATKVIYQDIDGDNVAVTFSKPILNPGNVDSVFLFSTGKVNGDNTVKQQLYGINLASVAAAAGTAITAAATRSAITGGDGQVNVGCINSVGIDLEAVTVAGDLGRIDAGDGNPLAPAVKSLNVRSMNRFGPDTQGLHSDTQSDIIGALGSLTVKGDIVGAFVFVNDGADGKIGSITVGGSLIGDAVALSGTIRSSGDIGVVNIGRDVQGGLGNGSGSIQSDLGAIKSVSVGGSLIGGEGQWTGQIRGSRDLGPVKVAHDVRGGLGPTSGFIASYTGFEPADTAVGKIASVTIGGSLIGGPSVEAGAISSKGDMGAVKIGHDVLGGAGGNSGWIHSEGKLASVTIGGSLIGGSNTSAGQISSKSDMGAVKIGNDVLGGSASRSGRIYSQGKLASVTIGGSLVGGSNTNTAEIVANGMGAIKIGHDVRGGGHHSGRIQGSNIASVNIGGSLVGGSGDFSGQIYAGEIGAVKVGDNVQGGTGQASGMIYGSTNVTIGGSLVGASGPRSGEISSDGNMGAVKIGHDLVGGSIMALGLFGRIASLAIGGSIFSGTIVAHDDIGSLTVAGSVVGTVNSVIIAARGQHTVLPGAKTDLAIGTIKIGGRVEFARILAGYAPDFATPGWPLQAVNTDAQIGAVTVGGDWVASSMVAGVSAGNDGKFGTDDDVKADSAVVTDGIVSKIASITIGGLALGTPKSVNAGDSFGFVAQQIGSLKVGGFGITLKDGLANVGLTGDLRALEVAL